jgi:hypothetical protein
MKIWMLQFYGIIWFLERDGLVGRVFVEFSVGREDSETLRPVDSLCDHHVVLVISEIFDLINLNG